MRVKKLFVLLLAAGMVSTATPAKGCSCGAADPRDILKASDGAVIATFLFRREVNPPPENGLISSGRPMDYYFRVDEEVKGEFGQRLRVRSVAEGASCGLEVRRGRQTGMFLRMRNGHWRSSLCEQIAPAELREAAAALPEPDGDGPPRVLVGGSYGEADSIALDAQGRTLGYAFGDHLVHDLSVCPGAELYAELYHDYAERPHLVVRDVETLEVVADHELFFLGRKWGGQQSADISCRTARAEEVAILSTNEGRGTDSYIWLVGEGDVDVVYAGGARWGQIYGERVYMREGARGRTLTYFDLDERERVKVTRLPFRSDLSLSPDRTRLADLSGDERARVTVFDLTADPVTFVRRDIGSYKSGEMVWLDDDTVALLPGGYDNSRIEIYDDQLNLVRKVPGTWYTGVNAYDEGVAWGIGWGSLYRAELPDGEAELVREFPSPYMWTLALVPEEDDG